MKDSIVVRGARQHNLKGFDLEIPRRTVTVVTGPSGSGKSSLAFDTIYAEGQRRYVESLSSYARQFLERMEKPDVEPVEELSPAVAIEQKNPTKTSPSMDSYSISTKSRRRSATSPARKSCSSSSIDLLRRQTRAGASPTQLGRRSSRAKVTASSCSPIRSFPRSTD